MVIGSNNHNETIKTLGLCWEPKEDFFLFNVEISETLDNITKRSILSHIYKLYDPLGIVSPVIVTEKIIMQSLWKSQISWDDQVPNDLASKWLQFKSTLNSINEIRTYYTIKL